MNIFVIEGFKNEVDWEKSARSLDNYRISKMLVETAQICSTSLNQLGIKAPYKSFNPKHPSILWTLESSHNFDCLLFYGSILYDEYKLRFQKESHKCNLVFSEIEKLFFNIGKERYSFHEPTLPKMAMPECFKDQNDIVGSYRKYFASKPRIRYPKDKVPEWFKEYRGDLPYVVV